MRTEYAIQEIGPDGNEHERYWVRPLYDHDGPLTNLEEARDRMTFLKGRKFRLLSRQVSDWEEVK